MIKSVWGIAAVILVMASSTILGLSIPDMAYQKRVLDNGLTVLLSEDHRHPAVYVRMTYHVGSAKEQPGYTGFAHFFEHMMFQGSKHVGDDQHFKWVTQAGGSLNGSTARDSTRYYQTVPADQLPLVLWLEADRMGFLLDTVTAQKFETQRAAVKNEKALNYDNRPYGLVDEKLSKALYPVDHPYSWLPIGDTQDLDRVQVSALKQFFLRRYQPNNAVLTIVGDIQPDQVMTWVTKYFGTIPKSDLPQIKTVPDVVVTQDRFVAYQDPYINRPAVAWAYPGVAMQDRDTSMALDCLSFLVSSGKNALFYQKLIRSQKALSLEAYNSSDEVGGEFCIFGIPSAETTPAQLFRGVTAVMTSLESEITTENIDRFKIQQESETLFGLQTIEAKGEALTRGEVFFKNPLRYQEDLKALQSLTADRVLGVYRRFLKDSSKVVVSVYPKGHSEVRVTTDTFVIPIKSEVSPLEESANPVPKIVDRFDRTVKPSAFGKLSVSKDSVWKAFVANKPPIPVYGITNRSFPTLRFSLCIDQMPVTPTKAGLAMLASRMMNEDTWHYSSEAFDRALEKLGSQISVSTDEGKVVVSVRCLTKNLDSTLVLLKERLFCPRLTQLAFDRLKSEQLQSLFLALRQPSALADAAFSRGIYGPHMILGIPETGRRDTVDRLTLADVKNWVETLKKRPMWISIVGDVGPDIVSKLAFLSSGSGSVKEKSLVLQRKQKGTLYFVPQPHAVQSEIRMGWLGTPYDATGNFYKATVMNYPFGLAPLSNRLILDLREEKGYTYSIFSYYTGTRKPGVFEIETSVVAMSTAAAIRDILDQLRTYQKFGLTKSEVSFSKTSLLRRQVMRCITPDQQMAYLNRIAEYHLPATYMRSQADVLAQLTRKELNQIARTRLFPEAMDVVVVGDPGLLPSLKKLGLPMVVVQPEDLF